MYFIIKIFGINKSIKNIISFIHFCGPIFIKISQNLIYKEYIPSNLKNELVKLGYKNNYDKIKLPDVPKSFKFSNFDKPIAVGSVAIVWKGKWNDKNAIIKIVKPNIKNDLNRSKFLFNVFLWWVKLLNKNFNILDTFEKTYIYQQMYSGLNMNIEKNNLIKFKHSFQPFEKFIKIPEVYYCNKNLIIESEEKGYHIEKFKKLYPDKLDHVINIIQALFYKMFFDNFLHADIHPANFFIQLNKFNQPKIVLLDFGLVESFDSNFFYKLIFLFQQNIFFPDLYKAIQLLAELNKFNNGNKKLFIKESNNYLNKINFKKQCHMMTYGTNDNVELIPFSQILNNILLIASKNKMKFPGNILILLNTFMLVDDYRSIQYGNSISWRNRYKFIKDNGFYDDFKEKILEII